MNISKNDLFSWCDAQFPEHLALIKTLAAIPAPSHHEELRAAFIKSWLIDNGAQTVIIDETNNVVLPLGWTGTPVLCVMAHTDVVFPDTTPLPLREENGRLYAPGVGDDTANVVALMLCAKFFLTHPGLILEPLLLVFNSCEEGLGNLKGVKQIMRDYAGRIGTVVSFDCQSDYVVSRAVGSQRWQVDVSTCGGHSFSDFGKANAIAKLSEFIAKLYQQSLPQKKNCTTTYNVGMISGGTSVNTIAQNAQMTYEYRSDDRQCLAVMEQQFYQLLKESQSIDAVFSVTNIGNRPCGGCVDGIHHTALIQRCADAIRYIYEIKPCLRAASTDANIPLSMGIPAATFGLYRGGGAHTREEYVDIDSLTPGLKIALCFFLSGILSD